MDIPRQDEVEAIVSAALARHGIPGAGIALVLNGDRSVVPVGVCQSGSNSAVSDETRFQLASCTKASTAAAIATLVDRRELRWDDRVREYLPDFRLYSEDISDLATLRDLLSMRLGLKPGGVMYWGRNQELGTDVLLTRLPHVEPVAGFRETFTYYNPAYTLLTEIVSRCTSVPYIQYLSDAVLTPAGLADTFVQEGLLKPHVSHALPHAALDAGVVPLGEARCGGRIGESCTYSSARDAARWITLQLNSGQIDGTAVVSPASMSEMHRPHVLSGGARAAGHQFIAYALGWQCRDSPQGPILLHEGGEFGVSTYIILSPDLHAGVAVYLNANIPAVARGIAHQLLDRLTGAPPRDWVGHLERLAAAERTAMSAAIDAMFPIETGNEISCGEVVGHYQHPVDGVIEVRESRAGLSMHVLDGWVYDADLQPLGGSVYSTTCHYLGTQSMARGLNRVRFIREGPAVWLEAVGLGRIRRL